jgi:hypothetical protein
MSTFQDWLNLRIAPQDNSVKTKPCKACKKVKLFSQFYKNNKAKDGVTLTCIACIAKKPSTNATPWRDGIVLSKAQRTEKATAFLPTGQHFHIATKQESDRTNSIKRLK